MRRLTSWGITLCILSLGSVGLAQQPSAGSQTPVQNGRVGQRLQSLTPEERAKLREQWATMSPEERAQARAKMREQLAGNRPVLQAAKKTAADQIVALKKEHQATLDELQKIKALAVKEKATETVKALDALIVSQQTTYQKRLQQMEQRLQRVHAAQRNAAQMAPKTGTNAATAPAQKRVKPAAKQGQK